MDKILDSDRLAQVSQQLREELGASQKLADDWVRRAAKVLVEQMLCTEVDEALQLAAFTRRDLRDFDVVYLFCDAVYESLRRHGCGCASAVLVTWAICSDGSRVLLHMSLGSKESGDAWLDHLRSLVSRNLPTPLTITTDGAPGLIKAVAAMWPESERLRCWFHKMQNILVKVPAEMKQTLYHLLQDVRDAPDYEAGKQRAASLIEQYQRQLPSAMACFADDLEASLAHLKLPTLHRRIIRTTNLCERAFEEQRRRTKVLPRFFDEKSCLKLTFATLWRASTRWRGLYFSDMEKQQLQGYIRVRQAMGKKVRDLLAA